MKTRHLFIFFKNLFICILKSSCIKYNLVYFFAFVNLLVKFETNIVNQGVDENISLDIFEMTISISEPRKEFVNINLLIFKQYQVDVKNIKCHFQWRQKHKTMFLIIGFLNHQILWIIESQIEMKRFFSLVGMLTILTRCHLQLDNLNFLIFLRTNWSNYLKVGCKSPFRFLKLIAIDVELEVQVLEE